MHKGVATATISDGAAGRAGRATGERNVDESACCKHSEVQRGTAGKTLICEEVNLTNFGCSMCVSAALSVPS